MFSKGTQYYFSCCRDGNYRQNKWTQRRSDKTRHSGQNSTRKINTFCTARIYATVHASGSVDVTYISTHTNHEPGVAESKHLPLPTTVKESISVKLQDGIPVERIMDGKISTYI